MKWNWKEWTIAALIRAVRTFAQTFAGCIDSNETRMIELYMKHYSKAQNQKQ